MKRSLLRMLCVALLFLTACSFTVRKNPVTENFTCKFTATYDDMKLGGSVQRGESGAVTLAITEPASLNGFVCRVDGEDMTLSLGDLEYKTEVIPAAAVPRLLREVLDALHRAPAETAEDVSVYTGTVGTYAFEARVTAKEGFIQSIAIPDAKLEIHFTEVTEN